MAPIDPSPVAQARGFRGVKTQTLPEAIAQATRQAIIDFFKATPALTFAGALDVLAEYEVDPADITIGDLTGAPAKPRNRKSQAVEAKAVDTRSEQGRAAYDNAVMDYLCEWASKSQPVSAQEIRKLCGGTPEQCRRSLNRWIEAGAIGFTGQARATRYYPA